MLNITFSEYVINEFELYNTIRIKTESGLIKCPNCNNSVGMHGTYKRKVILTEFDKKIITIIQVRCKSCKKVHAVIPGFILPNKQYCSDLINSVFSNEKLQTCSADDSTIRRWRKESDKKT